MVALYNFLCTPLLKIFNIANRLVILFPTYIIFNWHLFVLCLFSIVRIFYHKFCALCAFVWFDPGARLLLFLFYLLCFTNVYLDRKLNMFTFVVVVHKLKFTHIPVSILLSQTIRPPFFICLDLLIQWSS